MKKFDFKCPICSGSSVLIHKGTRDNPDINVLCCQNCRTKWLSNVLAGGGDYAHGFMNGTAEMSSEEIQKRINECRPDDLRRVQTVKRWCKMKDVLDFGCGFGGFLKGISKIAKTAVGVEVSLNEISYLRSFNLTVENSIERYSKNFDVITLFHVFEHLSNPQKWLNKFAEYLKDDGIVFIEVPNADDALLSLYECKSFADFTYWSAHLYLYTRESLTKLIKDNGQFDIELEGQVQRYPLSNHLYWLSNHKPGGHKKWQFFNSEKLDSEYKKALEKFFLCDTLFYRLRKRSLS